MNERIQSLLDQCLGSETSEPNTSRKEKNLDLEKFAELIVRECTKEIMYSSVGREDPVFAYEYVKHLKTTFSIAE